MQGILKVLFCSANNVSKFFLYHYADSSSDDDSVLDEDQLRNFQRGGQARDSGASSSSYSDHGASSPFHAGGGGSGGQSERPRSAQFSNYVIPGNTARNALADVMQAGRHCEWRMFAPLFLLNDMMEMDC